MNADIMARCAHSKSTAIITLWFANTTNVDTWLGVLILKALQSYHYNC